MILRLVFGYVDHFDVLGAVIFDKFGILYLERDVTRDILLL